MPRFAANLGFLWSDRPLLKRIEAAAKAGFGAIEMHWPYEVAAADVKRACERYGVRLLGINTVPGRLQDGDFGLGAVSGREEEFQGAIDQSVAYCVASGATAIHAMAGNVRAEHRIDARRVFVQNLRLAADKAARHDLTLLLEPSIRVIIRDTSTQRSRRRRISSRFRTARTSNCNSTSITLV
jgi:2-dehydrotetronate isomerase